MGTPLPPNYKGYTFKNTNFTFGETPDGHLIPIGGQLPPAGNYLSDDGTIWLHVDPSLKGGWEPLPVVSASTPQSGIRTGSPLGGAGAGSVGGDGTVTPSGSLVAGKPTPGVSYSPLPGGAIQATFSDGTKAVGHFTPDGYFTGKYLDGSPVAINEVTGETHSNMTDFSGNGTSNSLAQGTLFSDAKLTQNSNGTFTLNLPDGKGTHDVTMVPDSVDSNGQPLTGADGIAHFHSTDYNVQADGWKSKDGWQTGIVNSSDPNAPGFFSDVLGTIKNNPMEAIGTVFGLLGAAGLGYELAQKNQSILGLLLSGGSTLAGGIGGLYNFVKDLHITDQPFLWSSVITVAAVVIGYLLAKLMAKSTPKAQSKSPTDTPKVKPPQPTLPAWYNQATFQNTGAVFTVLGAVAFLGGLVAIGPGTGTVQSAHLGVGTSTTTLAELNSELNAATGGKYTAVDPTAPPLGMAFVFATSNSTAPHAGTDDQVVYVTRANDGGYNVNVVSLDYCGDAVGNGTPDSYNPFFTVSGNQVVPAAGTKTSLDTLGSMVNTASPVSPLSPQGKQGALCLAALQGHNATRLVRSSTSQ